jgi:hypothetical protein
VGEWSGPTASSPRRYRWGRTPTRTEAGDPDFVADGVGYRQVPLWLTDEEFTELAAEIGEAMRERLGNEPGDGRTRRLISTVLMPDVRATD